MPTNLGKKIFIIEDDANILYALKARFSAEGFEAHIETGSEDIEHIIDKVKTLKPELIILDLLLPRVNGFDILAKLKADGEVSKIPVFIFTNLSDPASRDKGKKLGGEYYFIKSDFTLDEFIDKIKNIIKNRR